MKTLQFKCKLLTDIIINQKAATEGNQQTLDFIPGSNFLGIAAHSLYKDKLNGSYDPESVLIFHSGKVRFGDAHPSIGSIRGLRVPAVMAHPKDNKNEYYILSSNPGREVLQLQLKQCRSGFYHFENKIGKEIPVNKSFSIKSAYDRNSRRSKDEAMYGYQSIESGTIMFFEIEFDDDIHRDIIEKVKQSLIGQKRTGRSRSAQYGIVEIKEHEFQNVQSKRAVTDIVSVYADSRLIFIDRYGIPTFLPTPQQLGIDDPNAQIIWEKSQIRTFQFAPWNFKRQTRDADRCGIEKGSVFYVKASSCPETSQFVGCFKNEGYGKVIYNPGFLEHRTDYKAEFQLMKSDENTSEAAIHEKTGIHDSLLIRFLKQQQHKEQLELKTIQLVNEFVESNKSDFKGKESFASQWGNIRKISMQFKTKEEINHELFLKTIEKNGKNIPFAYLTHGIAKDKWEERNRCKKLKDFVEKNDLTDENIQFAMINLASEMAKICRRKK